MANTNGPMFLTGANAKIFIGKKLLAYATEVSYNIDAVTIPVDVMGRFEVLSNETVAYGVNGTFTVVRYVKDVGVNSGMDDANQTGNSTDAMGIGSHMDPNRMLQSGTFELKIFQKYAEAADNTSVDAAGPVLASEVGILLIENCRIVQRTGTLTKRNILTETYSFVGVLGGDMKEDGTAVIGRTPHS